jgi:actin related protein 2/3 complex, subunit 5
MSQINYRTLNIDAYDPDSPLNFPLSTLLPSSLPAATNASEAVAIGQQIRQLLRSGDAEGALQGALDTAPLGGDEGAKQVHLSTVVEVLQGIRQSDVARLLAGLLKGDGGMGRADCLMKYLYVLLSSFIPHMIWEGSRLIYMGWSRYKGMSSQSTSSSSKPSISPQATGFSQMQARNLGEGGGGQAMSVLLSWHEKLVEIVGVGGIVRVMCDRRTV